jgi:hypothetical protein
VDGIHASPRSGGSSKLSLERLRLDESLAPKGRPSETGWKNHVEQKRKSYILIGLA